MRGRSLRFLPVRVFDSASAGRYGPNDVTPETIAPLFFLVTSLLLVSGALKLVRPRATARALLDAGLPGSRAVARGLGAGECAAAAFAVAAPARGGALALAIVYLAFAGFVGYVLRTHPTAGSCGCGGSAAVPPRLLHPGPHLVAEDALSIAGIGPGHPSLWPGVEPDAGAPG